MYIYTVHTHSIIVTISIYMLILKSNPVWYIFDNDSALR